MVEPRRVAWLAAVLLATVVPAAASTAEEAFERGNEAYAAGDWAAAAAEYRNVLDYRVTDARVYYNLANAEFRMGRLGPSILHYEKARRLDPADTEIQSNLRFVQGFRFDRVEVEETFALVDALHALQARLSVDGQAWVLLALLWIAGALMAWGLSRPGKFGPLYAWPLVALSTLIVLSGLSWWDTYERFERRELAVVMAPAAEIVAGPGPSNPSLLTVHEGLTVVVLDDRGDWIQVALPNGINGWIATRAIDRV
jgi:tetratricopeptide (TPR) repeat protein